MQEKLTKQVFAQNYTGLRASVIGVVRKHTVSRNNCRSTCNVWIVANTLTSMEPYLSEYTELFLLERYRAKSTIFN